jgi:hypothetical protein
MSTKTILKRSRAKDCPFISTPTTGVTAASASATRTSNTVKLTFNAPAEDYTDEDKEEVSLARERHSKDKLLVPTSLPV